jgi:hypothetical protein
MKNFLEVSNDRLLIEAMEAGPIGESEFDKLNKEVTQIYKIKGKQRIINKLEAIFDMINEASDGDVRESLDIEITLSLGGKDDTANRIKITRAGSSKALRQQEDELFVNKKTSIYL